MKKRYQIVKKNKNYHENGEQLFSELTPQLSTT